MRLTKLFNYHSPMLLTIQMNTRIWEIHGGTIFDFFLNMEWHNKGKNAQKKLIILYLEGLLKMIENIKSGKFSNNLELIGVSYILGRKNAEKLGFTVENASFKRQIMFIFDYISLLLMYSFTNGKIAFPNISKIIKLKIKADKLVVNENYIKTVVNRLKIKQ